MCCFRIRYSVAAAVCVLSACLCPAQEFSRNTEVYYLSFAVPGALGTYPMSLNNALAVAGYYYVTSTVTRGFLCDAEGAITTFAVSGAIWTEPESINAAADITGFYELAPGGSYVAGFYLHPDGFSARFDVPVEPGEGYRLENEVTTPETINAEGAIAGWFNVCSSCLPPCVWTSSTSGFVRSPQGVFTLFNPPGTIVTSPGPGLGTREGESLSAPHRLSINQAGSTTGSYTDGEQAQHAFVRNPYGTITPFDPPRGGQTTATRVNDNGVIAGSYYYNWNPQIAQGFLRIPQQ